MPPDLTARLKKLKGHHIVQDIRQALQAIIDQAAASPLPGLYGPKSLKQDQQEALALHNQKREQVSLAHAYPRPPLRWSDALAADSSAYARQLAAAGSFRHSGAAGVGENLYAHVGGGPGGGALAAATRAWMREEAGYDGRAVGWGWVRYGHYTQCVWPGTREVGMGFAAAKDGRVIVVARYWPRGNIVGRSAWTN